MKNARNLWTLFRRSSEFFPGKCRLRKFFVVHEPRQNALGKWLKKVVRNFPEKMWIYVWWSANRDKICKVFRESEKVENRCYSVQTTGHHRHCAANVQHVLIALIDSIDTDCDVLLKLFCVLFFREFALSYAWCTCTLVFLLVLSYIMCYCFCLHCSICAIISACTVLSICAAVCVVVERIFWLWTSMGTCPTTSAKMKKLSTSSNWKCQNEVHEQLQSLRH